MLPLFPTGGIQRSAQTSDLNLVCHHQNHPRHPLHDGLLLCPPRPHRRVVVRSLRLGRVRVGHCLRGGGDRRCVFNAHVDFIAREPKSRGGFGVDGVLPASRGAVRDCPAENSPHRCVVFVLGGVAGRGRRCSVAARRAFVRDHHYRGRGRVGQRCEHVAANVVRGRGEEWWWWSRGGGRGGGGGSGCGGRIWWWRWWWWWRWQSTRRQYTEWQQDDRQPTHHHPTTKGSCGVVRHVVCHTTGALDVGRHWGVQWIHVGHDFQRWAFRDVARVVYLFQTSTWGGYTGELDRLCKRSASICEPFC